MLRSAAPHRPPGSLPLRPRRLGRRPGRWSPLSFAPLHWGLLHLALLTTLAFGCAPAAPDGGADEAAAHADRPADAADPPAADFVAALPPSTAGRRSRAVRPRDASDKFFDRQPIVTLKIELSEPQATSLREEPRRWVRCRLIENGGSPYADAAVKLKGAAGSFQSLDERPAFTFNMDKFRDGQSFHALDKFHLNNSVQDETYACEAICAELCRELQLATPRVAHARVWLNDRDLGLYVLKEGFDAGFLKRHFRSADGNLYDGGFLQDVDADLEKDSGEGPDDFSDLQALVAACREPDPDRRWALLANAIDVDHFLTFMAFERMTCHWDGYVLNRNNYRIYFAPQDGKARFLPHGMDQMFGDPGAPLWDAPPSLIGSTVLQNPSWRRQYRQTVERALPLFSDAALVKKLDALRERLRPALAAIGPEADEHHAQVCQELRDRLIARAANVREQMSQPDPSPAAFDDDGRLALEGWEPRSESDDAALDAVDTDDGQELTIACGPSGSCVASWRRRLLLEQGRYRLEAAVRTEGVQPIEGDEKGAGAGLRISGGSRLSQAVGDSDWTSIAEEFSVDEPSREVELIAELRAVAGAAKFRSPIVLVRLAD